MQRLLVIDTATPACSAALFGDGEMLASDFKQLGRGHAEHLVGMIAALPERGKAERIFVNCGPGSFTGIRVGLAAAKALALAWQVPVAGYNGLQLAAHMAISDMPDDIADGNADHSKIFIANIAGHGELFGQLFDHKAQPLSAMQTLGPAAMADNVGAAHLAGSGLHLLPPPHCHSLDDALYPDARAFPARQIEIMQSLPARPVYGRAPDAMPAAKAVPADMQRPAA